MNSWDWAEHNPLHCPCGGRGWADLTDQDAWVRCPIHGQRVPHPEDDEASFDSAAHALTMRRAAYKHFRAEAFLLGVTPDVFRKRCAQRLGTRPTPQDWVNAAEAEAAACFHAEAESRAIKAGFSCRQEASLAADAAFERLCHSMGLDPATETHGPLAAERNSWFRR